MAKILITGGQGFVGKHIMPRLSTLGHEVFYYDLLSGCDIRDRFSLDRIFEEHQFDYVINLSARAGVRRGEDFPEEYFSTNVIGLDNIIKACEKYGVKKLIHFSSSSVFGTQLEGVGTDEDAPKKPRSVYGITKLAGELLLEKSSVNYVIIRPFTIIGENGRKEMVIYKWINQIKAGKNASFYGEGKSSRGYTYVQDLIDGVIACLFDREIKRTSFNLGGNQEVSLDELWSIFKEVRPDAEREMIPMPGTDQMFSLANCGKAYVELDWTHKTDIKQKIKEIIQKEFTI